MVLMEGYEVAEFCTARSPYCTVSVGENSIRLYRTKILASSYDINPLVSISTKKHNHFDSCEELDLVFKGKSKSN